MLILDFQPPAVENTFLLFKAPSLWGFATANPCDAEMPCRRGPGARLAGGSEARGSGVPPTGRDVAVVSAMPCMPP